jgi:NAD(P)-dependent dehydrogenase (short-subunit alcohol dehydrogenase family)
MKDFKDKVAVITGAASGIGYGLAECAAKEGMKVVLADIEEDALVKAERDIRVLGADTLAVKTDVSKADDVKALADKTIDTFGAVHLLFNNAGVTRIQAIWKSTLADWQWILGVNLWGVIHGIHFFVPIMLKQNDECHIVNTASINGLVTGPGGNPYCVSKFGVVALSETLYHELVLGGHNINISVLCPGFIKTKILDCERNRPRKLQNKSVEDIDMADTSVQAAIEMNVQLITEGMSPEEVAKIVFDAIRNKKFYILPNAEIIKPIMQTRMEDILEERNPTPLPDLK